MTISLSDVLFAILLRQPELHLILKILEPMVMKGSDFSCFISNFPFAFHLQLKIGYILTKTQLIL